MKLLIIDDHLMFLNGIRLQIPEEYECLIANTVEHGKELLLNHLDLDLALVDLRMPNGGGLEILAFVETSQLLVPIIILSSTEKPLEINQCLQAGASGFLAKSASISDLTLCIDEVLGGKFYISDEITPLLRDYEQKISELASLHSFGARHMQVLKELQKGYSNKEIGERLFISDLTVKSHMGLIMKALDAKNRVDCLTKAIQIGILGEEIA